MPLRLATYADLPRISETLAAAFYDEQLNDYFFPHRRQYPDDYVRAWHHCVVERWWDYNSIWLVNYEHVDSRVNEVVGVAQWCRAGVGSEAVWGLKSWDLRKSISRIISCFHSIHRLVFGNRSIGRPSASDPKPMQKWDFGPTIWPFISRHFTDLAHRQNHWELCLLGVDPHRQGRGVGGELVAWGIQRAKDDGLPAVVITAAGTEKFYRRCGFEVYVGACPDEDMVVEEKGKGGEGAEKRTIVNPLKQRGIGGGGIFWTREGADSKQPSAELPS